MHEVSRRAVGSSTTPGWMETRAIAPVHVAFRARIDPTGGPLTANFVIPSVGLDSLFCRVSRNRLLGEHSDRHAVGAHVGHVTHIASLGVHFDCFLGA